jgi:hypothetical protein
MRGGRKVVAQPPKQIVLQSGVVTRVANEISHQPLAERVLPEARRSDRGFDFRQLCRSLGGCIRLLHSLSLSI